MKLRTKTSIFFIIFFVAVTSTIVLYIDYSVIGAFKKQTQHNFRTIAEQSEGIYLSYLGGMKKRVVGWTSDNTIQELSKKLILTPDGSLERSRYASEFAKYIREKKMPYDSTIIVTDLLDKNGVVIASTQPGRIGKDEANEEVSGRKIHNFASTINSSQNEVYFSGMEFGYESSKPYVSATVRLSEPIGSNEFSPIDAVLLVYFDNTNEIADSLGIGEREIDIKTISRVSRQAFLESYKTSDMYFVNRDYTMVTPSRFMKNVQLKQKVETLPVLECLDNGKEISEEYENYQGIRVLGASMCFKDKGLVLLVEVHQDEIFAPLATLTRATIAGGITVVVSGLLIAIFFVRRPLSHLDNIVRVAKRVTDGDLNVLVDVKSKDEIGDLSVMFNTMVGSIRASQKALSESMVVLEEKSTALEKDVEEHKKQEQFLEESKRATLNLLEDSWKAKEALAEESNKLQTIISSIGDGLILIDGSYHVALVNPTASRMFGMTESELLGQDLRSIVTLWRKNKDVIPPSSWPIEEVLLTKKIITGTLEDNISLSTEKHPERIPIVFSFAPLGVENAGVVIIFRDATRDRELDEAKSGFISVASHQLRTPLTSIRWYSEMLLSQDAGPLNDSQKDFMNEIHGGAERLYQTVDLLLGISRVESGKLKMERTPIDVGAFTNEITKELRSQIDMKSLSLSVIPPDRESVIVWLDSLTLRQVVLNLVSNAIRYTNEKGLIEIKWWMGDEGREVVYMVHDNGIGIPERDRPRIFSKFFRAENARSQVPDGSGLGLALVKELVESWGGKIWFDTAEGQGSTFFFTVPLTTKVADISEHAKMNGTN